MIVQSVASLIIGLVIGYLGQKSRTCFVGGYRDFFIFRNTHLLKAVIGVLMGALIGFNVFRLVGGFVPNYPLVYNTPRVESKMLWILTLLSGLGFGFFSVLADGCPFRKCVESGEGKLDALMYVLGLFLGAVYFYLFVNEIITFLIRLI